MPAEWWDSTLPSGTVYSFLTIFLETICSTHPSGLSCIITPHYSRYLSKLDISNTHSSLLYYADNISFFFLKLIISYFVGLVYPHLPYFTVTEVKSLFPLWRGPCGFYSFTYFHFPICCIWSYTLINAGCLWNATTTASVPLAVNAPWTAPASPLPLLTAWPVSRRLQWLSRLDPVQVWQIPVLSGRCPQGLPCCPYWLKGRH